MTETVSLGPADLDAIGAAIPSLVGDIRSDHAGETGAVMLLRASNSAMGSGSKAAVAAGRLI